MFKKKKRNKPTFNEEFKNKMHRNFFNTKKIDFLKKIHNF